MIERKRIGQGSISSVCVVALAALALGAAACGGGAPPTVATGQPVLRVSMIPTTDPGYANKVLTVYFQMVSFAAKHS